MTRKLPGDVVSAAYGRMSWALVQGIGPAPQPFASYCMGAMPDDEDVGPDRVVIAAVRATACTSSAAVTGRASHRQYGWRAICKTPHVTETGSRRRPALSRAVETLPGR